VKGGRKKEDRKENYPVNIFLVTALTNFVKLFNENNCAMSNVMSKKTAQDGIGMAT